MNNRREFLKKLGLASAGLMLAKTDLFASPVNVMPKQIGLQLYTLRDILTKDPQEVFSKVSQIGYNHVETFFNYTGDPAKDLFWGTKPADFKQMLKDHNLETHSGHYGLNDYLTKGNGNDDALKGQIEIAATAGQQFLVVPVPPFALIDKMTADDYKFMAEQFNKAGELCHKSGLQLGYHNHFWEFKPLENNISGMEILLKETQKDLMKFELDLFWAVKAGQDPIKLFNKYPGQFVMWHVKDIDKQVAKPLYPETSPKPIMSYLGEIKYTEVGTGAVDFKGIFKHTDDVKYIFVEQDQIYMEDKYASIKMSYDYIKNQLI